MEDVFVKIPKEVFEDLAQEKKYESLAILAISLRDYSYRGRISIITSELMEFFEKANKTVRARQAKIKKGLEELGAKEGRFQLPDIFKSNENYIMAHDHNIDKILFSDIKSTVDRYKLITLYLAVMSHMGYDDRESDKTRMLFTFVGQKKLEEETNLSATAVNSYLKILIDIGVLMSHKVCDTYILDNTGVRSGRIYYSYISEDEVLNRYSKHKIKEYAKEHEKSLLAKGCKLYLDGKIINKDTTELNPIINAMTKETEYKEQVF